MKLLQSNEKWLRNEFTDTGDYSGGGGGFTDTGTVDDGGETDVVDDVDGLDGDPLDDLDDDGEGEKGNQSWDMNAFAQVLGNALRPQQAAPVAQKDMSDEEFRKLTGYMTVDQNVLASMGLLSEDQNENAQRIKALQQFYDNSASHSIKVANLMMQQMRQELSQQYQPLLQQQAQQRQQEFVNSVTSMSPSFKGMEQQVGMVISYMKSQGYQSQGPQADAKNVARMLVQTLRQQNPGFQLRRHTGGGGRTGVPKPAGSINSAGGGGGGRGNGQKQKLSPAQRLYS